jgi:integrase
MAGIEGFRFHDLRHTMASWYMMNGGDLDGVETHTNDSKTKFS